MSDLPPNPELLKSLGRLVRGLSALFWGLPLTLLACVQTAKSEWLRLYGIIPPLAATGLLLYGLWLMSSFQPQERVWRIALDRAKLFGLINLGLCPFLYWWNKLPGNPLFLSMVLILAFSSVLFLSSVNVVLQRLGAMLPDEGLRLNLRLLIFTFVLALIYVGLSHLERLPLWLGVLLAVLDRGSFWFLVLLVLLPLAMTMALLWKTKEVIMDSVFGSRH
jgi:hypothetical protein